MTWNGETYKFRISSDAEPEGSTVIHQAGDPEQSRSGFAVHPDGNPIGTMGCIGLRSSERGVRECLTNLGHGGRRYLRLSVTY
jgi:hypothetical protein